MTVTRFLLTTAIAVAWGPAWADSVCLIESIKSVVTPNDLILTVEGGAFQPLGQDSIDPADWRPGEKVVICPSFLNPNQPGLFDLLDVERGERLVTSKEAQP